MKRRDFLKTSAGLAWTALPGIAAAQSRPCPPPALAVAGGNEADATCASVESGDAPSWFLEMQDRTWTRVAGGLPGAQESRWSASDSRQQGARLIDIRPSLPPPVGVNAEVGAQMGVTRAYTGGCVDQVRGELILAANGGHNDYYGNEVYALALRREIPTWVRLTNPTPAALLNNTTIGPSNNIQGSNNDFKLGRAGPDGRPYGNPVAVHGWHKCCFGNGRVWYAGLTGGPGAGSGTVAVWSFDRDAADAIRKSNGGQPIGHMDAPWTYHGLPFEPLPGNVYSFNIEGGPATFDRVGNRVWSLAGASQLGAPNDIVHWSVDASTGRANTTYRKVNRNTASGIPDPEFGAQWAAFAHDVGPQGLLVAAQRYTKYICVFDPANPGAGFRYVLPTFDRGAEFSANNDGGDVNPYGTGAVYHAPSRSILTWNDEVGLAGGGNGAAIRKLAIPADPVKGDYRWSLVQPSSSNGVVPKPYADHQGVYGRFNIIEDMGNGQAALVVQLDTAGPTYVYKVPIGGV